MLNDYARHLRLPDTHNIRDLGGYARTSGGMTQWRRVLRGDSLAHLTPAGRDRLLSERLTLVIDLRGPHELLIEPNPFAQEDRVTYRNIALFDAMAPITMTPITMADTPFDMAARYRDALDRCGPRLAQVLRTIAQAPAGMVLFHCSAGKDRTGIVAALLLRLADVGEDEIAADYALTATLATPMLDRLRRAARERNVDRAHLELMLASDASTMQAMLAHLRVQHGGITNYCRAIGLGSAEIDGLVARLCH
ncbi:tyrosine-protein phosphatase [Chelatococcus asaccharovorans]|uniref:Protein-tyrosine phosphatase n=1 Tax=Chelatococcus asaccharovorans TaxID=28210 RepID=A0A2V3U637_9HYPH|nr:tyrosine-protein phosphatase [Chelatococcus asaccharovorans]MBS7703057.1 tyrosine-protein phosphatase [Chelatococcus asaccharovorans]PXW57356.1 protein-tyrosine phosphatase [Chelatococcus asaccharovorans]CAH1673608.1 Protein-tyrosine phosphatase [Chelatococcus asaccharovorans]CAH1674985.1 Protein-tyrosine phosphatase [Chelatococcus asaccharovorans]